MTLLKLARKESHLQIDPYLLCCLAIKNERNNSDEKLSPECKSNLSGKIFNRSTRPELFLKLTGKHLCQSFFFKSDSGRGVFL